MKLTKRQLRRMIRNVITESMDEIPLEGDGSLSNIIDACVKECQADPEADVETVCERATALYGLPYDAYQDVVAAVYRRL